MVSKSSAEANDPPAIAHHCRPQRSRGFRNYLYFICTDSPTINRERVAARVSQGGHDVPPEKITARYDRALKLLPEAIALCDRAYLFDNSGKKHRLVAEYEGANLIQVAQDLPNWLVRSLLLA